MKKSLRRSPLLRFVLALVALLFPAAALQADPGVADQAVQTDETSPVPVHPALWKLADADTTIWLFGTVHILPPDIDWLKGRVSDAFENSDELVTEILEPEPGEMSAIITRKAVRAPGDTLRDTFDADERARYEAALASLKVPVTMFDRYDAWYAAVGLSTLPVIQEGYASNNGVEKALVTRAKERGLPRVGLETPDYQIGIFDSLPEQTQERYLASVIDQLPTVKTDLAAMVEAWKSGDAAKLATLINDTETDAELLEILLIRRNRTWADWIAHRLERPGTVFMAVGAGHLAGVGSVQDQLAKAGFKVERVQ